MKLPVIVVICFLFFISSVGVTNINGQATSTDLDQFLINYARPDFVRRSLDLRPTMSTMIGNDAPGQFSSTNSLTFGGSARYAVVKNSRRWQSSNSYFLNTNLSSIEDRESLVSVSADLDINTRYFFSSDRYIASYNSIGFNVATGDNDNGVSSTNDVGIGFGRIELVTDAIHVSRIFDMLECAGVLLKEVTVEDLKVLVDTIATLKNQRFFDSRLQRIREVEAVTQYLSDMGYIQAGDYFSFAILSDAYDFEVAIRDFSSGSVFEILLGRDFGYFKNSGWQSADDARLTVRWQRNRVKAKYWSTRIDVGNTFSYRETQDVIGGRYKCNNDTYASYIAYFAPTRRVVLSWNNSANLVYNILEVANTSSTIKDLSLSSVCTLDYYISPQLRLYSTVRGRLSSTLDEDAALRRSLSFNVGILYSYF